MMRGARCEVRGPGLGVCSICFRGKGNFDLLVKKDKLRQKTNGDWLFFT